MTINNNNYYNNKSKRQIHGYIRMGSWLLKLLPRYIKIFRKSNNSKNHRKVKSVGNTIPITDQYPRN